MDGLTDHLIPKDRNQTENALLALAEATRDKKSVILAAFCAAFVEETNRVLLVQLGDYARGQIGGNPWTLPGGSVDMDEDSREASCREIAEEANVCIGSDQLQLAAWISRPYISRKNRQGEIILVFAASTKLQPAFANPPETVATKWSTFDLAAWLAVPENGQGSHPLQPLRRHWIYWTWFAWQRIRQSQDVRFLVYQSPEQMREKPEQIL